MRSRNAGAYCSCLRAPETDVAFNSESDCSLDCSPPPILLASAYPLLANSRLAFFNSLVASFRRLAERRQNSQNRPRPRRVPQKAQLPPQISRRRSSSNSKQSTYVASKLPCIHRV